MRDKVGEKTRPLSRAKDQARREEVSWTALRMKMAMTIATMVKAVAMAVDRNPCRSTKTGTYL